MRTYLRIQSPWSQLSIFVLSVSLSFFIAMLVSVGILFMGGLSINDQSHLDFSNAKVVGLLKWVQGISSIVLFLLPSFAFAFFAFNFRQFYFMGFRKQKNLNFYLLAFLILLCSYPLVGWLGEVNEHLPLAQWMIDSEKSAGKQMEAFLKVNQPMDLIYSIVLIALVPAICEEVFFRGCLQRIFIYLFKNPWAGIIVTGALFSAFHMEFAGFLPRMLLGILLGAIYWYSNSLWPSIIVHFINNAIQIIAVQYYPKMINENPHVPFILAFVSAILVAVLIFVLHKQSTVSYEKEYDMEKINEHNQFIA